jgi:hypothetical protein
VDHPNTGLLARYALGEITDEQELADFEEHLLECAACRHRALAVDLIGTVPEAEKDKLSLHISAGTGETPVAICGDEASRNIISRALLGGLDAALLCPKCLAAMTRADRGTAAHIN